MKIVRLWIPVWLAGLVVGCGQKGPLVLPDTPKHKKAVPSARTPPAPAQPVSESPAPAGTPMTDETKSNPSDATPKP